MSSSAFNLDFNINSTQAKQSLATLTTASASFNTSLNNSLSSVSSLDREIKLLSKEFAGLNINVKKTTTSFNSFNTVLKNTENLNPIKNISTSFSSAYKSINKINSSSNLFVSNLSKIETSVDSLTASLRNLERPLRNVSGMFSTISANTRNATAGINRLNSSFNNAFGSTAQRTQSSFSRNNTEILRGVDSLNTSLRSTDGNIGTLISSFGLWALAITPVVIGVKEIIAGGIELNRTIQSNTLGIGALMSANTEFQNSLNATSYDKFLLASSSAEKTLMDIKKASIETSATFPQLTEIFNNAYGLILGAGKAFGSTTEEITQNTIQFSKRMSNIAGAIRMPMYQVAEEIRSIAENSLTIQSRIGKGLLGLTNKMIIEAKKTEGGLVKLLDETLSDFDVLENEMTFDKGVARMQDAFDTIRIEASKPLFNELERAIFDFVDVLNNNSEEIIGFFTGFTKVVSVLGNAVLDTGGIVVNFGQSLKAVFVDFDFSKGITELVDGLNNAEDVVAGLTGFGTFSDKLVQNFETAKDDVQKIFDDTSLTLEQQIDKINDISKNARLGFDTSSLNGDRLVEYNKEVERFTSDIAKTIKTLTVKFESGELQVKDKSFKDSLNLEAMASYVKNKKVDLEKEFGLFLKSTSNEISLIGKKWESERGKLQSNFEKGINLNLWSSKDVDMSLGTERVKYYKGHYRELIELIKKENISLNEVLKNAEQKDALDYQSKVLEISRKRDIEIMKVAVAQQKAYNQYINSTPQVVKDKYPELIKKRMTSYASYMSKIAVKYQKEIDSLEKSSENANKVQSKINQNIATQKEAYRQIEKTIDYSKSAGYLFGLGNITKASEYFKKSLKDSFKNITGLTSTQIAEQKQLMLDSWKISQSEKIISDSDLESIFNVAGFKGVANKLKELSKTVDSDVIGETAKEWKTKAQDMFYSMSVATDKTIPDLNEKIKALDGMDLSGIFDNEKSQAVKSLIELGKSIYEELENGTVAEAIAKFKKELKKLNISDDKKTEIVQKMILSLNTKELDKKLDFYSKYDLTLTPKLESELFSKKLKEIREAYRDGFIDREQYLEVVADFNEAKITKRLDELSNYPFELTPELKTEVFNLQLEQMKYQIDKAVKEGDLTKEQGEKKYLEFEAKLNIDNVSDLERTFADSLTTGIVSAFQGDDVNAVLTNFADNLSGSVLNTVVSTMTQNTFAGNNVFAGLGNMNPYVIGGAAAYTLYKTNQEAIDNALFRTTRTIDSGFSLSGEIRGYLDNEIDLIQSYQTKQRNETLFYDESTWTEFENLTMYQEDTLKTMVSNFVDFYDQLIGISFSYSGAEISDYELAAQAITDLTGRNFYTYYKTWTESGSGTGWFGTDIFADGDKHMIEEISREEYDSKTSDKQREISEWGKLWESYADEADQSLAEYVLSLVNRIAASNDSINDALLSIGEDVRIYDKPTGKVKIFSDSFSLDLYELEDQFSNLKGSYSELVETAGLPSSWGLDEWVDNSQMIRDTFLESNDYAPRAIGAWSKFSSVLSETILLEYERTEALKDQSLKLEAIIEDITGSTEYSTKRISEAYETLGISENQESFIAKIEEFAVSNTILTDIQNEAITTIADSFDTTTSSIDELSDNISELNSTMSDFISDVISEYSLLGGTDKVEALTSDRKALYGELTAIASDGVSSNEIEAYTELLTKYQEVAKESLSTAQDSSSDLDFSKIYLDVLSESESLKKMQESGYISEPTTRILTNAELNNGYYSSTPTVTTTESNNVDLSKLIELLEKIVASTNDDKEIKVTIGSVDDAIDVSKLIQKIEYMSS
jgi:hypothetical protein